MTKFTKPVDKNTAISFLTELNDRGLSYHPDDPANDCLGHHNLPEETLDAISRNMIACFDFIDPYIVSVGLLNGFRAATKANLETVKDLYSDDDVAFFWEWKGIAFPEMVDGQFHVLILFDEHRFDEADSVKKVIDDFLENEVDLVDA
ncbi:MAG: hypothetical protein ABJL55_11900 [Roseibium sp.]